MYIRKIAEQQMCVGWVRPSLIEKLTSALRLIWLFFQLLTYELYDDDIAYRLFIKDEQKNIDLNTVKFTYTWYEHRMGVVNPENLSDSRRPL